MRTDAVTVRGTTVPAARSRTLYVGGFGTALSQPELRALLERHGEIDELRFVDRGDASFAYVTFAADAHAAAARQQLDGHTVAGRTLRVERAQ